MAHKSYLTRLGVYGFETVEPVILAALVTEDPLLLIGRSGTGKTFLLNSLSEALELEHRHYNASMISFDDLVGFPYPDADNTAVKFLETPATVWQAESVLIDEISRCKPEHQNRLFSLVHERKLQGISLTKLRFRWAAMNPCEPEDSAETYTGSEPLDPALADRFALFANAGEWGELSVADRRAVADPAGEGSFSNDRGDLKTHLAEWRVRFLAQLEACPSLILDYSALVVTHLNTASIRVSPRRARLLSRSLLAASIVTGKSADKQFLQVLESSLPHGAWGAPPTREKVKAAHRAAWDEVQRSPNAWVHQFLSLPKVSDRLALWLESCRDPDQGTQAVAQLLASAPKELAAVFAFAVFPKAVEGKLPIGAEGVNDLAKVAGPILRYEGTLKWSEPANQTPSPQRDFARYATVLSGLSGARAERANQFFGWCVLEHVVLVKPEAVEEQLEACVNLLRSR